MIDLGVQSVWFNRQISTYSDYACGWPSPFFHLASWALSSHQLARFFPYTELITDDIGAEVAQKLCLTYNHIRTDFEARKEKSMLWVCNKLYSYASQQQPFIHIDTDACFFQKLPETLLTAPLIAQNFEYDHQNYRQTYQEVMAHFTYRPALITKDDSGRINAVNAGVIGGTNWRFFQDFYAFVTDFLQQNESSFIKCQYDLFNVFVEQSLMIMFANEKKVPFSYVLPVEIPPCCDYPTTEFVKLPADCRYTHALLNYKHNPTVCVQLAQRLYLESPKLYERVLTVCREIEATHHYIEIVDQPKDPSYYYRTIYLLKVTGIKKNIDFSSVEVTEGIIYNLPESPHKSRITDVWQYESSRQAYIQSLADITDIWQQWQNSSKQVNYLLAKPTATYRQAIVRRTERCVRIESEWNWAEANEFAGQTADRDLAENLQIEPAYFEVLLYYYPHQQLVREQLLDILNMLLLDALDDPLSIEELIKSVSAQVLSYQPQADRIELSETLLMRIRHFLYHGVLEPVL